MLIHQKTIVFMFLFQNLSVDCGSRCLLTVLTCGGWLVINVGFDVRREVRGFCVLAWRQIGRYGRARCHRRRWVPSHRRAWIPRHHSTPTWLRDTDDDVCLDLKRTIKPKPWFYCRVDDMDGLPRSLLPGWRRCILLMAGCLDHWTAPTAEHRH